MSPDQVVAYAIYTSLSAFDYECAQNFRSSFPQSGGKSIEQQIREANTYWRYQLGNCVTMSTSEARSYLVDDCNLDDWISLFNHNVAPVIVRLRLPTQH